MLKRLSPVLAAGTIAALALAPVAFGGCGKPPKQCGSTAAGCVYSEPNVGNQCATGSGNSHLSSLIAQKLAQYNGKDKALLRALAGLGTRHLADTGPAGTPAPSWLDAAFGVGFGPIALFAVLLGTAIFLTGYSGVRRLRRRVP